jgi:phosphoribosylglycinamide formyltransferase-1
MLNIAVLGSGRGSNFQAILTAIQQGTLRNVRIAVVVSNNSGAGILEIARSEGIPVSHRTVSQFADEEEYCSALLEEFRTRGINFIVLAGYMKRLPARFVKEFHNRILNIHPALLPKFGGKGMYGEHVHRAVLAAGEKRSGATVHLVDEEYDHGPIVLQKEVPVDPTDTPETLAAKVLKVEHELYPEAIGLFAEGRVRCDKREIVIEQNS